MGQPEASHACRQILLVKLGNSSPLELGFHSCILTTENTMTSPGTLWQFHSRQAPLAAICFMADTTVPNLPLRYLMLE